MILGDFFKAVGQLGDPRFKRVMWLGLALSVALLVAVYAVFLWGLNAVMPANVMLPVFGEVPWIGSLISIGSIMLMLVLSIFLMVPVASLFTGLFLEDVAAAVEARHYPDLPPVARLTWGDVLKDTLTFLMILTFAQIALVILSVFFTPFAPILFYGVNGFLLGREYFQIAAMRRLGREGARLAFRDNVAPIWTAGVLMSIPLSIPLVNLIIPILGAATFTHLFHRLVAIAPAADRR